MQRSAFILVIVLSVLGEAATGAYVPTLPSIETHFLVDSSVLQWTVSGLVFAFALGQIVFGPMSDAFGRKPILLTGLGLTALGSLICGLAPSIEILIVGRIIQGLGVSAAYVVSRAMLKDAYTIEELPAKMSLMMLGFAITILAAPLFGGWVADLFGWRILFGLFLSISIVLMLSVTASIPETLVGRSKHFRLQSVLGAYWSLAQNKCFLRYVLTHSFGYAGLYVFLVAFPLLGSGVFQLNASETGVLIAVSMSGMIVGLVLARNLATQLDPNQSIFLGLTAMAVGLAVFAAIVLRSLSSLSLLITSQWLFMVGGGLMAPNTTASSLLASPKTAGLAAAGLGAVTMAAAGMAAAITGTVYSGTFAPILITQCVFAALSAGSFIGLRSRIK